MSGEAVDKAAQFQGAVIDAFKFLESRYGFSRLTSRPDRNTLLIRYETRTLYVILAYGPPAYEPEMSFGRHGVDDVPGAYSFEAGDLIQLDCCASWQWSKSYPNHIVGLVSEFARLLAACGSSCLSGDPITYGEMKSRRDKLISEWKRDELDKAHRSKVSAAWERKDYKAVVELLAEFGKDLSDLDRRRLQFAMARV